MKGFSWPQCAAALVLFGLSVSPAAASVNPSLSGTVTIHFALSPDDPETEPNESFWYFHSWSGGIALAVPSVFDITTVGSGNLNWSDPSNWSTFPLNTSGLTLNHTGSGGFTAVVNNGQANLNVLQNAGPTEYSVLTRVDFTSVSYAGPFSVISNTANTRYNVTLPSGVYMNPDQIPTLQNLTVNSGASLSNGAASLTIREDLTNHGSGDFNAVIAGDFINDAVAGSGNTANALYLDIAGQLVNTGELNVTQFLRTQSATSNAGSLFINGGTFSPQAAFANSGSMQFSAGNIDGPGVVTNNGSFDWSGGQIVSDVVNTTNSFTISGPDSRHLSGSVTNSGTITHSGGNILSFAGSAVLTNQAGALYDITDDSTLYDGSGGLGTIHNAGTIRKSGGSGVTSVSAALNNTGTVTVASGTLRLLGGGALDGGTMSLSNGGIVQLAHGDFDIQGANSAAGAGTLEITNIGNTNVIVANSNSGSFENFTGGADLIVNGGSLRADAGGTLTLNLTGSSTVQVTGPSGGGGGHIGGEGTTTNLGNFEWTQGTVEGNLTNSSHNFSISGDYHLISGGHLTNTHTITHSDNAELNFALQGVLDNEAGGLYDMVGDGDITGFDAGTLTNAGTFRKSGGSGTSMVTVPLTNTGTLAVHSGTLLFQGADALTLDPSGTLSFNLAGRDESTEYGKLTASHELELDGTFAITLEAGYEPGWGMTFDLLDWLTISGSFDGFTLSTLSGGKTWNTSQLDVTGVVSIGLPGDFNGNGTVGAEDYVVWRKGLGTTHIPSDYDLWVANFGLTSGGGSSAALGAVPEPASAVLLLAAMIGICCSTRFRRCV